MVKRRPWNAWSFAATLALGGLTAGCDPPTPAQPSFEADVRPIFLSHCVRCHGAGPDGGAINTATRPTGPDAAGLASETMNGVTLSTTGYYLDEYDQAGRPGALALARNGGTLLEEKIHGQVSTPMPPPPAPKLDDWELKVIDAWVAEKPQPICSNSPHPDPTICPPDAGQ
jgi:mono/diheme cytochrome c family protein